MLKENIITAKKIKIAAICFGVFSIGAIVCVIGINLSRIGKVAVDIKYAPFEASVFIDGQNYSQNNAVNYLEPGPHHIMVALNGFKTLQEDVEVTEGTRYLYGKLEALDDNDSEIYQKYQSDYLLVEGIGGEKSEEKSQSLKDEWPILQYLPYIGKNYSIGTSFNANNDLVISIYAEPVQIDNAISKLQSFGGSLSEYNIIIDNFQNELEDKFIDNNSSDPIAFLEKGYQGLNVPYQINNGRYIDGYYCATVSVGKYAGYIPVTYRIILQDKGNSWGVVGTPYPIATEYNSPNIDVTVLNTVNNLDSPDTVRPDSSGDGH